MGCRSRRRTAALRTRGPPARGGGPRLAPLPPATRIMALRVSYLPPHAPCVMAASGLCLPFPTPKPHGGGPKAPGWGPQNPCSCATRLEGGGARRCAVRAPATLHPPYATPDPTPDPPLSPTPAGPCCIIRAVRAARRAEAPRTAPSAPPPRQLALKANRRLAGCCAGGARRPGNSYPPPTEVCTHGTGHRHPLGGSHTTTHHSTTATGGRE